LNYRRELSLGLGDLIPQVQVGEETPTSRASSNSSLHSNSLNLEELYSHIETTKLISLVCALGEKIHSRDPSQLIPTGANELGFHGMPPPGARGLAYIAL
jgi:hypothetical protein